MENNSENKEVVLASALGANIRFVLMCTFFVGGLYYVIFKLN